MRVTIKLNTNENPYPPSPRVMEAIRGVTGEQLRRYPSPTGKAFREAAGGVHGVRADWILPFNGGDELAVGGDTGGGGGEGCGGVFGAFVFAVSGADGVERVAGGEGGGMKLKGTRWRLPGGIEKVGAKISADC